MQKLSKTEVIALRQKALNQAKYNAKKWFDNGWENQILACVDVTFPDSSRDISFKDTDNHFNNFDFIYNGSIFCFVQYDGIKMKITKGEKMSLKTLDDNLANELNNL